MSIIPEFQYLLVMPSGNIKGFDDLDTTKAYINLYYMQQVRNSDIITEVNDLTDSSEQFINTVCQNLGVIEGECRVYKTNDIIEKIQEDIVFDEEKEELISKLLSKNININIYDFAIDNIFNDVEAINVMETYGEFWS
jgi:hypothetical protein